MRFDASSAECRVHTYKEGLLSVIAHDLEIRVGDFTIDVDEGAWQLAARFDARSLRVAGAMQEGVLAPGTLSEGDQHTIEEHIVRDVLHADRFPEIRFVSGAAQARGDALDLTGTLTLHNVERPLTVSARRDGARWVAAATIHQPDFGIRPYSAMFGTLRIRPDVAVQVVVPVPAR
jgi:hypothetical protein